MPEIRIRLELEDWKTLIRGGVVEKKEPGGTVKIILAELGWDVMAQDLARAAGESRKR